MPTIRVNLLLILFALLLYACGAGPEQRQLPPPELPYFEARTDTFQVYEEFVGQTYGASDIDIRARVEGFLEAIHFQEGSRVRKGQLLYTIDPQPFQAKVAAAQSRVAEANTVLVRAKSDLDRIEPLAEINAVSQADLDAARASYGAAQASVEAAQAELELSNIELGYTHIYSPIDGIIGKTEARVGDFVGRGFNAVVLNTVSQLDPILVRFSIPEAQYLRVSRYYLEHQDAPRPRQGGQELQLFLADGSEYPYKGKLDFLDRTIDPATGTLLLQASFPNPDNLIRPGQFARVRGVIDRIPEAILVPQRSVSELQGIFQVYVVTDSNKVEVRPVQTGPREGNMWVLTGGVEPGEHVLLEGLQRVQPGQEIRPVLADFEPIQ